MTHFHRRSFTFLAIAGLLIAASNQFFPTAMAQVQDGLTNPFPQAVAVPAGILDGGTEWLNTAQPIDMQDLKGKIVILDFWTYCCINCMHVLPDLKFLEEKYPNQIVVIGIHSAKFDNEKDSENIRDAILRYEINHPVVNDSEMILWRKFGTRSWPTIAIVDPEGKFAGSQSGEGNRDLLDAVVTQLIKYHRWKGTLDETPLVFASEAGKVQPTSLRYPGKVLADEASQRVFITDSNHNRIIVASMSGELLHLIGNGRSGMTDGAFDVAEFNRPQGTVLVGNTLYVADTENHSLRVVDLETKTVSTLAGTGRQGSPGFLSGKLLESSLNSPWSIAHVAGTLYIAMAGPHQVWSHEVGSEIISVYAGSGREDVVNGPLSTCAFAQPSEIVPSPDGKFLYLVDSEGSAIRRLPTGGKGRVTTIAGTSEMPRGQSLFAFGFTDGVGSRARFQHPLGVAVFEDSLVVADSYNHALRQIELKTEKVSTAAGTGTAGISLDPLLLSEPGGLSVAGSSLYIADTNNHRIVVMDLKSKQSRIFEIAGLSGPTPPEVAPARDTADAINVEAKSIAAGRQLAVKVALSIPNGYKLNDLSPVTWEIFTAEE
ncbi:MAG: thioredoxin-like domain-containing protein, partial [Planctomycetota bacterium]|nr:thioredoxin-like domain-containing protein [Planctomycetota bacterium]